jgi:hypothetical protein
MSRRPTALHGVACTACAACFFPDHRLSISGSIVLLVHSCSADGETRTPHLAHGAGGACRTAPIRWWRAMRYGASPRNPDPAPLFPASSDRYPNSLVLLTVTSIDVCFRSLGWLIRDPRMVRAALIDHGAAVPIAPRGAHQLPASQRSLACRGRAVWSCVSVVMRSSVRANRCRVAAMLPETRNRAADVRPTHFSRGWANAHASGVVHRLVNIGTRLPGRAV